MAFNVFLLPRSWNRANQTDLNANGTTPHKLETEKQVGPIWKRYFSQLSRCIVWMLSK